MGLIPQNEGHARWPTSVFHTGKEARLVRGLPSLGEVMTHP
jgi:hypothetical protein